MACYDWKMRDYGQDVFAGTAKFYAKYRPKYPAALFKDIVQIFKLDGQGRMLDLGCGTGEMAIPLAKYFDLVLALDPDEQMLELAKSQALATKIRNISWQKGSSKELEQLSGPFKLVTMGQSFHWMDQELVLNQLYRLIKDGGVAVVGTEPVKQRSDTEKKDKVVAELIKKYLGPERRAGKFIYQAPPKRYEELLPNSIFGNFAENYYVITKTRSIDQIIGHLYSMSWARRDYFGDNLSKFEAELKAKLLAINPSGKFQEKFKFSLYTLQK